MPDDILSKYIGIPYKHKGRDLSGLDCWGLARLVYRDLGVELKEIEDYELEGSVQDNAYVDKWIKLNAPRPYDIALFLNNKGIANHAGIITPDLRMIHASAGHGVSIVHLSTVLKMINLDAYYHLKARDDNHKI